MPLPSFRSRLEQKLQATADAARRDIPAANIRDQLPPRALGPRGDTGQGYTSADHSHTASGDGGVLVNDAHAGYSVYQEIAAPSAPAANTARLYAKDTAGVTELYYKNSAGAERDLSATGGGGGMTDPTTTKGDLIVHGATTDRLPVGADDEVLIADSGEVLGVRWGVPAGGGSSAVTTGTSAAVIPGLAGSADIAGAAGAGTAEEFDTGTDPFTWSSNPATHDSNTTIKSHLYLLTTDSLERLGTKAWAPGGDFDVRMKVAMGSDSTPNYTVGIHIGNSGNTTRLLTQLQSAANGTFTISHFTYSGGSYAQIGTATPLSGANEVYLRITRTGTTIGYYYSSNGLMWQLWTSATFSITVANLGLRLFSASAVNCYAAIDWLRTDV